MCFRQIWDYEIILYYCITEGSRKGLKGDGSFKKGKSDKLTQVTSFPWHLSFPVTHPNGKLFAEAAQARRVVHKNPLCAHNKWYLKRRSYEVAQQWLLLDCTGAVIVPHYSIIPRATSLSMVLITKMEQSLLLMSNSQKHFLFFLFFSFFLIPSLVYCQAIF